MAVDMTNTQLKFATPTFTDAGGAAVPIEALTLAYTSADETIAKWEMRKADGSVGDAADAGAMAVTAQGPLGSTSVTITATNPDASTAAVSEDIVVALSPKHNATTGTMVLGDAVEKV